MLGILFTVLLLVLVVIAAVLGIYVVRQQEAVIIERFGRFNRITGAGIHVRIPVVETIAHTVELRTLESKYSLNGKTKDNVTIGMDVSVQYRVAQGGAQNPTESGAYRSFYMLSNPVGQMGSYISDALRSAIPGYTLDEVFDNKDLIAGNVRESVSALMEGYGFDVVSTLITNIKLPSDVERSMNAINSAQRDQQAATALAEADRIKTVVAAKAEAEAMEQTGIGIANQRRAIADGIAGSLDAIKASGVSPAEANSLFLYTQWCDMMAGFAEQGKSSTVVLPSSYSQSTDLVGSLIAAGEHMKPNPQQKPTHNRRQ